MPDYPNVFFRTPEPGEPRQVDSETHLHYFKAFRPLITNRLFWPLAELANHRHVSLWLPALSAAEQAIGKGVDKHSLTSELVRVSSARSPTRFTGIKHQCWWPSVDNFEIQLTVVPLDQNTRSYRLNALREGRRFVVSGDDVVRSEILPFPNFPGAQDGWVPRVSQVYPIAVQQFVQTFESQLREPIPEVDPRHFTQKLAPPQRQAQPIIPTSDPTDLKDAQLSALASQAVASFFSAYRNPILLKTLTGEELEALTQAAELFEMFDEAGTCRGILNERIAKAKRSFLNKPHNSDPSHVTGTSHATPTRAAMRRSHLKRILHVRLDTLRSCDAASPTKVRTALVQVAEVQEAMGKPELAELSLFEALRTYYATPFTAPDHKHPEILGRYARALRHSRKYSLASYALSHPFAEASSAFTPFAQSVYGAQFPSQRGSFSHEIGLAILRRTDRTATDTQLATAYLRAARDAFCEQLEGDLPELLIPITTQCVTEQLEAFLRSGCWDELEESLFKLSTLQRSEPRSSTCVNPRDLLSQAPILHRLATLAQGESARAALDSLLTPPTQSPQLDL